MPLLLVRHAWAGDRDAWEGADRARPLDKRGRRQAGRLVERLETYPIEAILSSPARRCVETVEPLARVRGLEIEERAELSEERQDAEGVALVRSLAARDVVVCGHGGLEHALPDAPKWKKGAVFVVGPRLDVLNVL
ncbi:MAG TPA: phosphoglycerate mutase family protein [Gaiellaceae bacterium]|jgi:8-oxo-dGTP diphosphatase|nr:phosphoglycerate mutase family protein [Gaiellaceae bacterium]